MSLHALKVATYLRDKKLKFPEGLQALADVEEAAEAAVGAETDSPVDKPQAPIRLAKTALHPGVPEFDLSAIQDMFSCAVGTERPNIHVRVLNLPAGATAKQRADREASYLEDEEAGVEVHKQSMIARRQRQALDQKPEAGRTGRYTKGVRYAIQSDDKEGTGYEYDEVYQVHVHSNGNLLGSSDETDLVLSGEMKVGYARVLELRKL